MVHNYVEYAKTFAADSYDRAMIELFPMAVDFFGAIPYKTAPGGKYGYHREGELPSNMGFRGINETPSEGHGVINDLVESCYPIAGNIDVDRVLIDRFGADRRATERNMSVKKKMKVWADTFIDGDNATEPREWTGMKNRLQVVGSSVDGSNYESRVMANSESSGGGALSLKQLDIAIGLVENPTHIIMNKTLKDRFAAAQRDTGIGGFITFDKDEMGRPVTRYGELPIMTGYGISPFGAYLPFNEVGYGGGSAVTSSIYVVSFTEEGVCGIETSPMKVTDMGMLENGVHYRDNIEHDQGIAVESPYAAIRFSSVTNAAIVK